MAYKCRVEDEGVQTYTYSVGKKNNCRIDRYGGKSKGDLDVPNYLSGFTVTLIRANAFTRKHIRSVTLPDSLRQIEPGAFYKCPDLTGAVLPSTLRKLEGNPFYDCPLLESLETRGGGRFQAQEDVLYDTEEHVLICYPDAKESVTYKIPEGTRSIAPWAFGSNPFLRRLEIPASVESISENAFPDRLKSGQRFIVTRESYAQFWCDENDYDFRYAGEDKENPEKAQPFDGDLGEDGFKSDEPLEDAKLTFPERVKSKLDHLLQEKGISPKADYTCRGMRNRFFLTQCEVPEGTTTLGAEAFDSCRQLVRVSLPASLETIGANPFTRCDALRYIVLDPENKVFRIVNSVLFEQKTKRLISYPAGIHARHYAVPEGTSIIGELAFDDTSLESIALPASLTQIAYSAFRCADELTFIVRKDSLGETFCKQNGLSFTYADDEDFLKEE